MVKNKYGTSYVAKVGVHKVPSSGKYMMHGYIERTLKNGVYDIVSKQTLTFNMRKDAEDAATKLRSRYRSEIKSLVRS